MIVADDNYVASLIIESSNAAELVVIEFKRELLQNDYWRK